MFPATRFDRLSRWSAFVVLLAWMGLTAWGIFLTRTTTILVTEHSGRSSTSTPDSVFYRAVVDRVAAGENYYDVLDDEFRSREAPPASVFQYRMPVYAWLHAHLPGMPMLILLFVIAAWLCCAMLGREGGLLLIPPALLALSGTFSLARLPNVYLFTELWVGTLIAIAVACFYFQRTTPALIATFLALFLRELTAPFVLVCLTTAVLQRRRHETIAWIAGGTLYSMSFLLHAREVHAHLAGFHAGVSPGWVRFGGYAFVLATTQLNNLFLIDADSAWTALVLPLALLGIGGWPGSVGTRIGATVFLYLVLFWVAGQPFNAYWGMMIAPLLCLGFSWSPWALRDLVRAVLGVQADHPESGHPITP